MTDTHLKSTEVERQALQLNLIDLQGQLLHQQHIDQSEALQRVSVPVGEYGSLFLQNVVSSTQKQQVKL